MKKLDNFFDHFVEGRIFEWTMSCSMIGLSIQIGIWPRTVDFSAFRDLSKIMSDEFIGLFMGVFGSARIISLILNGHTVYGVVIGPVIRSILAVFCAFMWSQFAFALFQVSIVSGRPSPGLPFWSMFVVAELYVSYRAVRHVG